MGNPAEHTPEPGYPIPEVTWAADAELQRHRIARGTDYLGEAKTRLRIFNPVLDEAFRQHVKGSGIEQGSPEFERHYKLLLTTHDLLLISGGVSLDQVIIPGIAE